MARHTTAALGVLALLGIWIASPVYSQPVAMAQADSSIWTVNVTKVKPGMLPYARRYYEAAWLPARRAAKALGYIKSFRVLAVDKEDTDQPEFVLITEYPDQAAFDAREARFDEIFAKLGTNRPVIDGKGRDDIFVSVEGLEDYRDISDGH